MANWFLFSRKSDKKEPWETYPAENRDEVLKELKPTYVTVLDCNYSFKEGTEEPQGGIKYRGPMYFDWDASDGIEEVLNAVRQFMETLESYSFDVSQARWFLSGGRGVHCEVPQECFMDPRLISSGVPNLFLAYRRFAFENLTEYLDMRVYTGKRGRQWRTTFNNRGTEGNPRYKVAISPEELRAMTTEDEYLEKCRTPCHSVETKPPTLNLQLQVQIQAALDDNKVRGDKNKRANRQIFRDWSDTPPTFKEVFSGKLVDMNRDLNDIKMQMALAAIASGIKDPDEYVKMCKGFVEERLKLKGTSHNTKKSVDRELEATFNYFLDNPSYVYTPEQFESILLPEHRGSMDVRGIPEEESARLDMNRAASTGDMAADAFGVLKQGPKGVDVISDYAWQEGSVILIKDESGCLVEISAIPVVDGVPQPRMTIDAQVFHKPAKLLEHVTRYEAFALVNNANECQRVTRAILKAATRDRQGSVMMPCNTEGYFVAPSGERDEEGNHIYNQFWVEPERVTYHRDNLVTLSNGQPARKYMYVNGANRQGLFGSRMLETQIPTAETPKFKETVMALLEINGDPYTLGALLGWFTACVARQPLLKTRILQSFPILQNVGQAGSGKTTQLRALMKMFPHTNDDVLSASSASMFAIQSMVSGSSTMPVIIDEYKPQNLEKQRVQALKALILEAYTPDGLKPKGGGTSSDSHYSTLNMQRGAGPLGLISELYDSSQAAIVERSVTARFSKLSIYKRREYIETVQRNEAQVSMLGRLVVEKLLNTDLNHLINLYDKCKRIAIERFSQVGNDRIVLNAAVVAYGLEFLQEAILSVFPKNVDITRRFNVMLEALRDRNNWVLSAQSEVAMFLETLANLSHGRGLTSEANSFIRDTHYTFENVDDEEVLIIDLNTAFTVYRRQMISLHLAPAFDGLGGLIHAIQFSTYCKAIDHHDKLGVSAQLDLRLMAEEKLSTFKRK